MTIFGAMRTLLRCSGGVGVCNLAWPIPEVARRPPLPRIIECAGPLKEIDYRLPEECVMWEVAPVSMYQEKSEDVGCIEEKA